MLNESRTDAQKKHVGRYLIATVGSRTAHGGEVITGCPGQCIEEHLFARVGDVVRYPDGTESTITSGAGWASLLDDKPVALVGSQIANGDRIVSSTQNVCEVVLEEGDAPIVGFLDPGYIPPQITGNA